MVLKKKNSKLNTERLTSKGVQPGLIKFKNKSCYFAKKVACVTAMWFGEENTIAIVFQDSNVHNLKQNMASVG